ncbi:MAG: protein kinase [Lachnospiraceae bacterium]|nr:protein kinase [Lachnospiraceae bacterium]
MEIEKKYNKEPIWNSWYIDKLLGSGSFGTVYRIKREEFGNIQYAALKIIAVPSKEEDISKCYMEGMTESEVWEYYESVVQEIYNEINLMTKVKGKSNIVSYEDHKIVKRTDGKLGYYIYIRMELLTGLYEYIQNHAFTPKDVVRMGMDLCQALCICEKHHIVHRDIKPENIFITPDGDFKLGDFGIAKSIEHNPKGGSIKGSYAYMAPEIYAGRQYNHKVDIYSLGIVMYTFLNNRKIPFIKEEPITTYTKQKQAMEKRLCGEEVPLLDSVCTQLAKVIDKAIKFNPNERYEAAGDFLEELKTVLPLVEGEHMDSDWNKTIVLAPNSNPLSISRQITIKEEIEVKKNPYSLSPKKEKNGVKNMFLCLFAFLLVVGFGVVKHRKNTCFFQINERLVGNINLRARSYVNNNKSMKVEIPEEMLFQLDWSGLGVNDWKIFKYWEETEKQLELIGIWDLSGNKLTEINPLEKATNLRNLDISDNTIADLAVLKKCKKLSFLNITGNPTKDITWIKDLKELQILWLGKTEIEDISGLGYLSQLQDLHLEETKITDLLPLRNCKKLTQLDLTGCDNLENLDPLLSLEHLRFVSLDGTKVEKKDIERLYEHMLETTGEAYVICPNGEEYVAIT